MGPYTHSSRTNNDIVSRLNSKARNAFTRQQAFLLMNSYHQALYASINQYHPKTCATLPAIQHLIYYSLDSHLTDSFSTLRMSPTLKYRFERKATLSFSLSLSFSNAPILPFSCAYPINYVRLYQCCIENIHSTTINKNETRKCPFYFVVV